MTPTDREREGQESRRRAAQSQILVAEADHEIRRAQVMAKRLRRTTELYLERERDQRVNG